MKLNKIKKILVIVILSCLLFLILIPLWWAIVLSFDRTSTLALPDFSIFPHEFSFFNYQMAGKLLNLGQYYKNTIFITIVNTCVSVFTAIACGYAFAKGIFPGKKLWYILFLSFVSSLLWCSCQQIFFGWFDFLHHMCCFAVLFKVFFFH